MLRRAQWAFRRAVCLQGAAFDSAGAVVAQGSDSDGSVFGFEVERLFCEQLAYNLMWQWFLDRDLEEGTFNHSVFSKNYERVLSTEVAQLFFKEVYELSREENGPVTITSVPTDH